MRCDAAGLLLPRGDKRSSFVIVAGGRSSSRRRRRTSARGRCTTTSRSCTPPQTRKLVAFPLREVTGFLELPRTPAFCRPSTSYEHQIFFFESHFTELKLGISPNMTQLSWCIQSQPQVSFAFTPGMWYNFAYDIDFTAGTVGLWASQGSAALVRVAANKAASTSTNSADFHVGLLAMNQGSFAEDWYISGVYIEVRFTRGKGRCRDSDIVIPSCGQSGTLTAALMSGGLNNVGGNPVGSGPGGPTTVPTTSTTSTTSATPTSKSTTTTSIVTFRGTTTSTNSKPTTTSTSTPVSTASGPTQTHYGQVRDLTSQRSKQAMLTLHVSVWWTNLYGPDSLRRSLHVQGLQPVLLSVLVIHRIVSVRVDVVSQNQLCCSMAFVGASGSSWYRVTFHDSFPSHRYFHRPLGAKPEAHSRQVTRCSMAPSALRMLVLMPMRPALGVKGLTVTTASRELVWPQRGA